MAVTFVAGATVARSASPTATADPPAEEDARPQIHGLSDIATGSDGNLWFTSAGNNRIGRITPSGEITTFRDPANRVRGPTGITGGPDESVWFVSSDNDRIGRITISGSITTFKDRSGRIREPTDITTGPDRKLWFTSTDNDRIGRITPSGEITIFADRRGVDFPLDITAGPDGNVWFTNDHGRIGRMTPSGETTTFKKQGLGHVSGITAGPDGNVWFTSLLSNRIGRITPIGPDHDVRDHRPGTRTHRHGSGRQPVVHKPPQQPDRPVHAIGGDHTLSPALTGRSPSDDGAQARSSALAC